MSLMKPRRPRIVRRPAKPRKPRGTWKVDNRCYRAMMRILIANKPGMTRREALTLTKTILGE